MLKNTIFYQKSIFDSSFKTLEILMGQAEQALINYWLKESKCEEIAPLNSIMAEYKNEWKKYKKIMERIITCFIFLALCYGIGYANEKITLATINYQPYTGESLPSYGIASQIVSEAFKRVDYDVKLKFYPWKRSFLYAQRGKYDGIFTIWYRQEREKWFVFSDSFMASELVFYIRKGEGIHYKKIEDLRPYTVGVVNGYAYPLDFIQAQLNTESVMKDKLNILKLEGNRVNAIVIDRIVGRYLFNLHFPEKSDTFIFLKPEIKIEKIYLAISKQTKDHRKKVNDFNVGLEQIKQEGFLRQILMTHDAFVD